MPFKEGNQLWKKGVSVKREKGDKIDAFLITLGGTGMIRYAEIMDKIAGGKEMSKADEQFMDRLEGWREYVKPKLARSEVTGKDGKDLLPTPILGGTLNGDGDNRERQKGKDSKGK